MDLDEKTLHDVVLWEKGELDFNKTLPMIAKLAATDSLWVLRDEAGRLACVEMMKEEMDGECS